MSRIPGYRAPGGRLMEGVRPQLEAVAYPVPRSRVAPVLKATHQFDKAHITMLAECGVIPLRDAAAMLEALRRLEDPDVVERRLEVGGGNHSGEVFLTQELGEKVAGHIHTGRSSGDLSAVGNRLTLLEHILSLLDSLRELRERLLQLADESKETLMLGYSHMQHAQPTTLGHYWAGWAAQFERDFRRLLDAYDRANESPAGAAALTGSPFPLNPARTAELLGFARPFVNSRDAIWSHDYYLEPLSALALLANSQARLAEDLNVWSTQEFGYVELADGFCLNSSILPQKKNPIALQHIRGIAGIALGRLVAAMNITRAPSDAVVIDRYLATEQVWLSFADLKGTTELCTAVLGDLRVDMERLKSTAFTSWAIASDIAAILVKQRKLPWRTAQQIVSVVVREALEAGKGPGDVTPEDFDRAAIARTGEPLRLTPDEIASALDPAVAVRERRVPGGPAPEDVARQVQVFRANLEADAERLRELQRSRREADERLERAIDALLERARQSGQ